MLLITIAVLAILSAAFLLIRYGKRQAIPISQQDNFLSEPPPNARPLFAPTDDELKQLAAAEEAAAIARREYRARAVDREFVDAALDVWRRDPTAVNAASLLDACVEHGLDGDFPRAADEILKVYRETGIAGLDDSDMAALMDSHIRLADQRSAGSGALFWLKQEVASLRSGQ